MSLYERLNEVQGGGAGDAGPAGGSPAAGAAPQATGPQVNSVQELRLRVHGRLIDELGSTLYDLSLIHI